MFGKKKQVKQIPQTQMPIEELVREVNKSDVQEVQQPVRKAWIISTEALENGTYRNVIISNCIMGEVGESFDLE